MSKQLCTVFIGRLRKVYNIRACKLASSVSDGSIDWEPTSAPISNSLMIYLIPGSDLRYSDTPIAKNSCLIVRQSYIIFFCVHYRTTATVEESATAGKPATARGLQQQISSNNKNASFSTNLPRLKSKSIANYEWNMDRYVGDSKTIHVSKSRPFWNK
jgi:hypothetical protein